MTRDQGTNVPGSSLSTRWYARKLERVRAAGFLDGQEASIMIHVDAGLLERAKAKTGIKSTEDLIAVGLLALVEEDGFGAALSKAWGSIPTDTDLGI